jgi:hypothetical protein
MLHVTNGDSAGNTLRQTGRARGGDVGLGGVPPTGARGARGVGRRLALSDGTVYAQLELRLTPNG